jgi:hypothetical protein
MGFFYGLLALPSLILIFFLSCATSTRQWLSLALFCLGVEETLA